MGNKDLLAEFFKNNYPGMMAHGSLIEVINNFCAAKNGVAHYFVIGIPTPASVTADRKIRVVPVSLSGGHAPAVACFSAPVSEGFNSPWLFGIDHASSGESENEVILHLTPIRVLAEEELNHPALKILLARSKHFLFEQSSTQVASCFNFDETFVRLKQWAASLPGPQPHFARPLNREVVFQHYCYTAAMQHHCLSEALNCFVL